jgi:hypothetical protein
MNFGKSGLGAKAGIISLSTREIWREREREKEREKERERERERENAKAYF